MQTCSLAAMHHAKLYSLSTTLSHSEGLFLCCLFQQRAHCCISANPSELEWLSRRRRTLKMGSDSFDPAGLVVSCSQQSGTSAVQPVLFQLLMVPIAPRHKSRGPSHAERRHTSPQPAWACIIPLIFRAQVYVVAREIHFAPASVYMHRATQHPKHLVAPAIWFLCFGSRCSSDAACGIPERMATAGRGVVVWLSLAWFQEARSSGVPAFSALPKITNMAGKCSK